MHFRARASSKEIKHSSNVLTLILRHVSRVHKSVVILDLKIFRETY
jgi:hypothetical protein